MVEQRGENAVGQPAVDVDQVRAPGKADGHSVPFEREQLGTHVVMHRIGLRRHGQHASEIEDGVAHYSGHRNLGGPASALAQEMVAYQHRSRENTGSTYYDPGAEGASELVWHNDQSHRPMLKVVSVLEALEVDPGVVPTEF